MYFTLFRLFTPQMATVTADAAHAAAAPRPHVVVSIGGVAVRFPFEPYACQIDYMQQVRQRELLNSESPASFPLPQVRRGGLWVDLTG